MKARDLKPGTVLRFDWGAMHPAEEGTVLGVESVYGCFQVRVRLESGNDHYLGLDDESVDARRGSASPIGWVLKQAEGA